MDWSVVLNVVLIPALTGLGGLFVWYIKFQVPKIEARKDAELEARLKNRDDRREHFQTTENVAIEVLREIIRESIHEYSKETQEIKETLYRLGRQVDQNTQSVRTLAGIISEKK